VRILWGACEPLHTARPLGPLLDVVERTGGDLAAQLAGAARPHDVATALLRELRAHPGTVLVLEDVHWADEATLDVLMLLAPRVGDAPALVVATYRDDEPDAGQFRFVLGELLRRCRRLRIHPFSEAAVRQLAEPHGVDGRELHRSTGGNPFFVTEVLAAAGGDLPETVREAVLARARRLSPAAQRLVEAVAVVPGQVDVSLLGEIAGALGERLEECLGSGILRADRRHISFRHELARRAVADATAPDRAIALHRAALAALAEGPAELRDVAALAHHADAAGESEAALRWAPAAAEIAAAAGAHREAAGQYERALRHAGSLPLEQRVALLQRRADECWLSSQFEEGIAAQREVLSAHRRLGDARREGSALRVLSRLLFFAARADEGEPLAAEAVAILERLPAGHDLAMAYGNLSQRCMAIEDSEGALRWGRRALELAERLGDTEALVYALTNIGVAELQAAPDGGVEKVERALALAREHQLDEYAGRAYSSLVLWPVHFRRYDLAARHMDEGLAFCSERGLEIWRLYLLAARSRLELDRGRWDEATDCAEPVLRSPRSSPIARGTALVTIALVRARRGDPDVASPLGEASAIARALAEEPAQVVPMAAAEAEVAWLDGRPEAVGELTDAALRLARARRARWAVRELTYWRRLAGLVDDVDAGGPGSPEAWLRLGCPYEAALLEAETGDEASARAALERLGELGAQAAARAVAARLRDRGVRHVPRGPRSQTRRNPAGLTARELTVLTLLADGLQNVEIATRLVLSVRTVEHHVAAILRKLGCRTRGAAAAEAARRGLLD
jgi:DNA-binding CsgD family transcriptional regulator/tetratricopeptide (TPR) repeat protein